MSDLDAARRFMAGHARLLDRRRFELLFDGRDPEPVLDALRAYRNADGGYGHGLEPDLRAPESQPAAAFHAFEVLAEVATKTPEAAQLCDWLDRNALLDGGLPLAVAVADDTACAPFWANADPEAFSLQITSLVATHAHRVAEHDGAVARDLERLAGEQADDGGWSVDFQSYSPAAALEWRGYATVRALTVLRDNALGSD